MKIHKLFLEAKAKLFTKVSQLMTILNEFVVDFGETNEDTTLLSQMNLAPRSQEIIQIIHKYYAAVFPDT